jgi:hypothetical protein
VQALPDPTTHTRSLGERLRIAAGSVSASARAAVSGLQKMADETVTLDDGVCAHFPHARARARHAMTRLTRPGLGDRMHRTQTTVTLGMARARFAEPLFNPTSAGVYVALGKRGPVLALLTPA